MLDLVWPARVLLVASYSQVERTYFSLLFLLLALDHQSSDGTRAFARADVYDTTTNTWSTSSSALSLARSILAAGAAGNRIVFAGGQDSSGTASGVVDIYDVQQDTWTRSPYSLCVPRYFLTGVGAYGGKVFFAGGTSAIGEGGAILWCVSLLSKHFPLLTQEKGMYLTIMMYL